MNDIKLKLKVEEEKAGKIGNASPFEQMLYNKTKVVEKEFKRVGNPFEVGKIFEAGDTIGLNNVSDVKLESDNFYFEPYETTNQTDGLMINAKYLGNGKFSLYILNDYEDLYEGEEDTIELDLGVYGVSVPFDYMGWKLVRLENNPGTYSLIGDYEDVEVETQLTAQEVYDKLNTGIGYKTAKVVVKSIENETYEITLPEIVDMFNGSLLIKNSNNKILKVVFDITDNIFKIHKENFTENSIELQGFLFGNDGLGSENYITLFVNGLLTDFRLKGGEEVEIMYFVSPFTMYAEV